MRLQELAQTRQLFLLREALQQLRWNPADTLLYRGIVESHCGQERKAIEDLTRFLAGRPSPAQRRTAYDELAAALARVGEYAAADRNVTEALRFTPEAERADGVNTQHLYAAVAGVPPQSVAFQKDVPVRPRSTSLVRGTCLSTSTASAASGSSIPVRTGRRSRRARPRDWALRHVSRT